ncbi:glycine zipper 2TM domain-containing protein [Rhodoferax sp. WC2427]|uniref:glycine zipper 2TM domain-containing protein n=1 Tax=Rhodoferax sp. WC2427 TaxID=3234144 RepID=UPI003466142B
MQKILILSALTLVSGVVAAQETGRVISATPLTQQVAVPRQVCSNQQVAVEAPRSGAGALMGGIAGGAMGNAIGGGSGRAAATMLGIVGGAILGNNIEAPGPTQLQTVQNCSTQTFFETRNMGYSVVYEYAGKQYTTTLPNDPGPSIALQVTPVDGFGSSNMPPVRAPVQQQVISGGYYQPEPVYAAPAPVVVQAVPYYRPVLPIGLELNFGYQRGGRHWR